ncbi:VOC family protein [Gordonia sp. SID5947]|uniref:VOC family protein n=1 Tax=Gordonia sp. SID5947 TaxID=2690315 RepID=UPI00136BF768|nr:VOC family protein [Gordonia sp. SID5947]MYR07732.1 VOC family protein [Gordonia sp. SID5947]
MLDHVALQCADPARAADFYLSVFSAVGVREAMRFERDEGPVIGLSGADGRPQLWVGPLDDAGDRPIHLALSAPSREAVDEVFAAARAAGATILHAPRVWPEYHPNYYGVFLRDLDGNNVEAVHHGLGG